MKGNRLATEVVKGAMDACDLKKYLEWFDSYVGEFLEGTDEDVANIELKRHHSLRVLSEAQSITASLDGPLPMVQITHIAALLHDVGRFPQYRRYKTYNDRDSENHGRLGVTVLRGAPVLSRLSREQRNLVLAAVFLHNRASLPAGLSRSLSRVVRIIRDADKLDIIPTVIDNLSPGSPSNRIVSLGLESNHGRYSEAVYQKILEQQTVDMGEMRWVNDFKLVLLGWLYTLNFPASRIAVLERGYIDRLLATLPPKPELGALGETIRRALDREGDRVDRKT
jgi:hypothetical protein